MALDFLFPGASTKRERGQDDRVLESPDMRALRHGEARHQAIRLRGYVATEGKDRTAARQNGEGRSPVAAGIGIDVADGLRGRASIAELLADLVGCVRRRSFQCDGHAPGAQGHSSGACFLRGSRQSGRAPVDGSDRHQWGSKHAGRPNVVGGDPGRGVGIAAWGKVERARLRPRTREVECELPVPARIRRKRLLQRDARIHAPRSVIRSGPLAKLPTKAVLGGALVT